VFSPTLELRCRFGFIDVPARWHSEEEVRSDIGLPTPETLHPNDTHPTPYRQKLKVDDAGTKQSIFASVILMWGHQLQKPLWMHRTGMSAGSTLTSSAVHNLTPCLRNHTRLHAGRQSSRTCACACPSPRMVWSTRMRLFSSSCRRRPSLGKPYFNRLEQCKPPT
jgi:hypothetical protein